MCDSLLSMTTQHFLLFCCPETVDSIVYYSVLLMCLRKEALTKEELIGFPFGWIFYSDNLVQNFQNEKNKFKIHLIKANLSLTCILYVPFPIKHILNL